MTNDHRGLDEIQIHATGPDGQDYSFGSFTGSGVAGPPFLGAEDNAPRWAQSLVSIVNRGLGLLPRKPAEEAFTVLYVFDGQGHQVCMIETEDRAEAEAKAFEVAAEIRAGSFDASTYGD
jgi:hypothetical protein